MPSVTLYDDEKLSLDGYLKELLDGFKYAVEKGNTSVVIIVDGRSGMGKTTLSNQMATYLDANYRFGKQIYFNPITFFEEGLPNAKDGTCLVFDEAMIFSSRNTLNWINKKLVQAMSMIRSKRIFVIFNVNSIFDLDRNIALSRADCLIHCYGEHLLDRGNFTAFFRAKGGEDRLKLLYLLGKKYYSYSKPKANFHGVFYPKFILDEDNYNIEKNKGVNEFLKSSEKNTYGKHSKTEGLLIAYLHNVLGISVDEIATISGITTRSVYNKLKLHKNYDENTIKLV